LTNQTDKLQFTHQVLLSVILMILIILL